MEGHNILNTEKDVYERQSPLDRRPLGPFAGAMPPNSEEPKGHASMGDVVGGCLTCDALWSDMIAARRDSSGWVEKRALSVNAGGTPRNPSASDREGIWVRESGKASAGKGHNGYQTRPIPRGGSVRLGPQPRWLYWCHISTANAGGNSEARWSLAPGRCLCHSPRSGRWARRTTLDS